MAFSHKHPHEPSSPPETRSEPVAKKPFANHAMAIARVLLTIPTAERVGPFPAVVVIVCTLLVFFLAFANYTYDMATALTQDFALNYEILDIMCIFAPPVGLLFSYVVFQTRVRLNYPRKNGWSTAHTILFVISFLFSCLYILNRPTECLSFVTTLLPADADKSQLDSVVNVLEGLKEKVPYLFDCYESSLLGGWLSRILLWIASWAFPLETVVALLFTSMACSQYGERQIVVGIKSVGNDFRTHVEGSTHGRKKPSAKKA